MSFLNERNTGATINRNEYQYKRSHPSLDASEQQRGLTKRQTLEATAIAGTSNPFISGSGKNPIVEPGLEISGGGLFRPQPLRITDLGNWNISTLLGNSEPTTTHHQITNNAQVPYPSAPPSDSIPGTTKAITLFGQRIEIPTPMDIDSNSGSLNNNDQNVAVAAPSATTSVANNSRIRIKKFPENVKKMLLTGIFEGVPVKYTSWDRNKKLRGVIKGTKFRCGCENCKFDKVVNSKEFETHAGCKTKHPNDNIYFANGISLYGVLEVLQKTSRENLVHVIPDVAGPMINKQNFSNWKANFQADSRRN